MEKKQIELIKKKNKLFLMDSHVHTAGVEFFNLFVPCAPLAQGTRDIVEKMDKSGIDSAIAFPMSFPLYYDPREVRLSGEWIPTGLEEFPYQTLNSALLFETRDYADKLFPFFAIDPREKVMDQVSFLERNISLGRVFGLKLHTRSVNSPAQSLENTPFPRLLEKRDIPIVFHTGCDGVSSPLNALDFARRHPNIRVCLAHFARFSRVALQKAQEADNVFVDTAPLLMLCERARNNQKGVFQDRLGMNYANPAEVLVGMAEYLGRKLMWGSDEPWTYITDGEGNVLSHSSYSDESRVLFELADNGGADTVRDIAMSTPFHFLFGDQGNGRFLRFTKNL